LVGEVGDACGGDVAAFGSDHLVVDLDQQSTDETDDGGVVGKDPDDVGASLEFAVQAFDRVVGPDLGPVRGRERGVGEQVGLHLLEPVGDGGRVGAELIDDCTQLQRRCGGVGLDEDRADQRGDHLPVAVVRGGEQVPHRVHPAALP